MLARHAYGSMGRTEWALLLALSVVFGCAFLFVRILARELPPLTIVMGRLVIGALALNLWLRLRGGRLPLSPRLWLRLLPLGALNAVLPFWCFAVSERHVPTGLAAVLNATTPVFAVLVGAGLKIGTPLTPLRALAVLFGVAGVAVLIGPAAIDGNSDAASAGLVLVAALAYALGSYATRRFADLGWQTLAVAQTTAGAFVVTPLALIFERPWTLPPPSPEAWGALAGIGLLSTAAAYLFYFRILERADPADLMLVTFLSPISALLLGYLALGEAVRPAAYAGMTMIGLSLAAIDGRLPGLVWRRLRPARAAP